MVYEVVYEDIRDLVEAGFTPAEIKAIKSQTTVGPIVLGDLTSWLITNKLGEQSTTTASGWLGPLNSVLVDETKPFEIRKGLDFFFGYINHPKTVAMWTNTPEHGALMCFLLNGLVAMTIVTPEQRTSFYQRGGGLCVIDEAGVVTMIRHHQNVQDALQLQSAIKARSDAWKPVVASVTAAIETNTLTDLTLILAAIETALQPQG